jgi:thioredoxin:protein disulfide reductase
VTSFGCQTTAHRVRKICACFFFAATLLCVLTSSFAQEPKLPAAKDVVKPKAYVSLDKVPRGGTFEVAVIADILPGFHVNSNKPSEDYLIPTQLLPELPAGFKILSTVYPTGKLTKFEFSEKKLSVYEGTFRLRMKIQAPARAPVGKTKLPLLLRYQACTNSACLPPVKIPVAVEIEVAASGAAAHSLHPEVFKN